MQWLPLPAFTALAEPHAAEVRADVAAPPKEARPFLQVIDVVPSPTIEAFLRW